MSHMKRLILILLLLMLTTALTCSQTPINVTGSKGLSILNSLTQSQTSLNQTNDSINATNNNTTNLNGIKGTSSSDFWSWGTKPKNYPGYFSNDNSADDYLSDPTTDLSNDI